MSETRAQIDMPNEISASEINAESPAENGAEDAQKPTRDSKNAGVGAKARRPRRKQPSKSSKRASQNPFSRVFTRHNDTSDLDGLIRAHAKLLTQVGKGEVSMDRGEALSRMFVRHQSLVTARDEIRQRDALIHELRVGNALPANLHPALIEQFVPPEEK